jgi:hypothetical protein
LDKDASTTTKKGAFGNEEILMDAWGFGKRFETEGAEAGATGSAVEDDLVKEDFCAGDFFADNFEMEDLEADGI